MMSTITWQQVAIVAIMLGFTLAAHVYLGQSAGLAMSSAATLVAFLLRRKVES